MNYKQLTSIYFSPTGSTKAVAELIAAQIPGQKESLDLTEASKTRPDYRFTENEVVLVGVPVYGGRVPETAIERFQKLQGRQTPAILLVTYGNRAYEDALLELKQVLKERGFRPMSAAAVVTEHSIVRSIAAGRPDAHDRELLAQYGQRLAQQLADVRCNYEIPDLVVKDNYPYKERHVLPLKIKVSSSCTGCGTCIRSCPVQAISCTDPKVMDEARCIYCMRCVQVCPVGGRKLGTLTQLMIAQKLKKVCADRKEPEFIV